MSAAKGGILALTAEVLELYSFRDMRAAERKLAELNEGAGDLKDRLLLTLAIEVYELECGQRVEMTVALHPSDKAVIEREAHLRKTTPADLMTMANLRQIRPEHRK